MPLGSVIVRCMRVRLITNWHASTSASANDVNILKFTMQNLGSLN